MSGRWEYLTVTWSLTATPPASAGEAWRLDGAFQIARPGATGFETRRYDASHPSTIPFELLGELGADGWELISHVVDRSAIAPAQGYETAGIPIASTQIFKRPAAAS